MMVEILKLLACGKLLFLFIGEHQKFELFSMYVLALAGTFLDSFFLLPDAKYRHPTLLLSPLFGAFSVKLVAALLVFISYYAMT